MARNVRRSFAMWVRRGMGKREPRSQSWRLPFRDWSLGSCRLPPIGTACSSSCTLYYATPPPHLPSSPSKVFEPFGGLKTAIDAVVRGLGPEEVVRMNVSWEGGGGYGLVKMQDGHDTQRQ